MSSTTPSSFPPGSSASSASASASPSLTERRKAATRMEIARAAARLFVTHGLRGTRAEDIAQAAGIAPRTFYRYFATKEEAVAPLYAAGAQRWAEAVRTAPAGLSVPQALEHAVRHTLTPGAGVSAAAWEWARTLIRLARTSPGLRKVWAEVCQEAEGGLANVLAERERAERLARETAERERAERLARETAVREEEPVAPDNVADEGAVSPHLRFAAAVASAAVRVAVESWAGSDDPYDGASGPVESALRNLGALRGFPWEERGD
ncbi:TetR/AcrR family transcriptional regulator [Streptomyces sp. NPDC057877]|uniref:TetR/AcrR family transcriptional regulator n=1 Tax=Streptomyces sp. NPDC057877 TaxID=3346269 RepID=UPI00367E3A8B